VYESLPVYHCVDRRPAAGENRKKIFVLI